MIELSWIELSWIELSWIEKNWNKMNWIELKAEMDLLYVIEKLSNQVLADFKSVKKWKAWLSGSLPNQKVQGAFAIVIWALPFLFY